MNFQLTDEQRDLVEMARTLAGREFAPDGFAPDGTGLPRRYLRTLASKGLAGIAFAEEDGGQGGTLLDAVLVIQAVAAISAGGGDALHVLNFGAIAQLARHADAEQKRRLLAPCLAGEKLISIAMTEPDAGSAVTDLRTTARREGDEVVILGRKIFTSNGESADCFLVWAKFGEGSRSAGSILVERGATGFEIDASHTFMSGERYGMLYLDECRVPAADVILWEDGFAKMMSVFNVERLGNSARSLAYGEAALELAVEHVKQRRQFGRRLAEFQGLQWRLAEMKLKLDGARLLLYRAAVNANAGVPSALEASLAKLACNRAGFDAANDALQLLGGFGYDDEAAVSYMFRRTRGWMIAGGTVETLLDRIAAGVLDENFSQRPARPAPEPQTA